MGANKHYTLITEASSTNSKDVAHNNPAPFQSKKLICPNSEGKAYALLLHAPRGKFRDDSTKNLWAHVVSLKKIYA